MNKDTRKKVGASKKITMPKGLEHINIDAAGIDVGASSHYVAVPEGRDEKTVLL